MKAYRNKLFQGGRIITALLAGVLVVCRTPAQPTPQLAENRVLFIFDMASDMKKRKPAVQIALDLLLASNLRGQMHAGDSIAVWTFDRKLHSEHLLLRWVPGNAATIASNITRFVTRQHYSKKTSFDALHPALDRVVQDSDRLTVLIFCDGNGQMTGTPFDSGVNRIFQTERAKQKKARQPFILVLRSQLGRYAGCTMNLPPASVGLPPFPPWPSPPAQPTNALPSPVQTTNVPPPTPPPPSVEVPPLIIIGDKTKTNLPAP